MHLHSQDLSNRALTVVGLGIKFYSHISNETTSHIQKASKVLYLVNNDYFKEWIQQNNPSAESLDVLYVTHEKRQDNYKAITNYILTVLEEYQDVCVVFYGHPGVFANPALQAVKKARELGCDAILLPAISAEDCLFADLLIDPGTVGCQSYEATDLLFYQRIVDPSCHVILWQIGVLGNLNVVKDSVGTEKLELLMKYLLKFYPNSHKIFLYEAAQLPSESCVIKEFELKQLPQIMLNSISTLYIPPAIKKQYNAELFDELGFRK